MNRRRLEIVFLFLTVGLSAVAAAWVLWPRTGLEGCTEAERICLRWLGPATCEVGPDCRP